MAGTITASIVKNDTTSPTQFQNSAGTQIGTLSRAWVQFDTSTGTIPSGGSFNVGSVTRSGTGQYTVNFTNAFADANYAVTVGYSLRGIGNSANSVASYVSLSTGSISLQQVLTAPSGGTAYDQGVMCVSVFR